MRRFLDTSALVPAFFEAHEHHAASAAVFRRSNRADTFYAALTLAEFYSTLSGSAFRSSSEETRLAVREVLRCVTPLALTDQEYAATLEAAATAAVAGGAVYDWLIACCALKAEADRIYTWNVRHFSRFGAPIASLLRTPAEG